MTQEKQAGAAPAGAGHGHGGHHRERTSSPPAHDDHHGHSVAAWTAVAIVLVGSLVMSFAVVFTSVWLFVVGAVIAVAGGVAGKVLSAMGFGAEPSGAHKDPSGSTGIR